MLSNDNATQAQVNAALRAITEAKAALNGAATDKEALREASTTDATNTKAKPEYYNADAAKKAAYDKAVADAVPVLAKENATQAEVDAALKVITDAKKELDGAAIPAAKTAVGTEGSLTLEEKNLIRERVTAVNPGTTVVVDENGNATVTTADGMRETIIPAKSLVKKKEDVTKRNAGNDVNTPAAKTVVGNPTNLTGDDKKAIEDKVKAVNSEGTTVVVDDKGNATVAKGDGTVLNIPASDLIIPLENNKLEDKLKEEAKNAKIKTPAIRTLVGDKENLTSTEIEAVKKAIKAVNLGATVVVDDKGNATVTVPDDSTATISKEQLVKTEAEAKSKDGGDNINLNFRNVLVEDFNNITKEDKVKFQFMMLGAINNVEEFDINSLNIEMDKDGNAKVTLPKGSKLTIKVDNNGNTVIKSNDGKTELVVNFDGKGNATVVTKDGKVLAIPAEKIFKQKSRSNSGMSSNDGNSNRENTTNTERKVDKAKLESAIHQLDDLIINQADKLDENSTKEAKALLEEAKKVFANADATQAEVDAMVKRIEDFMAKVAPSTDHATPANDQSAQTSAVAPATTQAAANASQEAANARKAAKELPNTGTADSTVAMVAAAASALLGLGLAGRRRKEDEEA